MAYFFIPKNSYLVRNRVETPLKMERPVEARPCLPMPSQLHPATLHQSRAVVQSFGGCAGLREDCSARNNCNMHFNAVRKANRVESKRSIRRTVKTDMAKKRKWYGVRLGYKVGVFDTWDECKLQVDGFKGAVFKAFDSQQEALDFANDGQSARVPQANDSSSTPEGVAVGLSSRAPAHQGAASLSLAKKRGRVAEAALSHDSASPAHACRAPRLVEGIGGRLLEQCGWKGGGLGAQENGILNPINPVVMPGKRSGIGSIDGGAAVTVEDIACSGYPSRPLPSHAQQLLPPRDLSRDQLRFFELAQSGCNIFLTGLGGTGKSHVLKLVVKMLRLKWGDGSVKAGRSAVVLASSTGVSAVSIGGVTLHSVAGCGVPRYAVHFDRMWSRKKFWRSMRVRRRSSWRRVPLMHLCAGSCS